MGRLPTARSFWDRLDPKVTFGCFEFSADELAGFLKAQLVLGHVFPAACRFVVLEAIFLVFRGFRRQRFASFPLPVS